MEKEILQVRMLGGFSMVYQEKTLVFDRNYISKSTQLLQILFLYQLQVHRCDKAALRSYRIDKSFLLQLNISALRRNHTNPQILRQTPDRRQRRIRFQIAADDLFLQLRIDLLIDRLAALIINNNVHCIFLSHSALRVFYCIYAVYTA